MRRRLSIWFVGVALILMFLGSSQGMASPPSSTPPASPKALSQIQSEAYALQADVQSNAGRKTSASSECSGATTVLGAATYTTDTAWSSVNYRFTGVQKVALSSAHNVLNFTIDNSCIDGGGLLGAFTANDTTPFPIYVWDGIKGAYFTFRNSTFKNASVFLLSQSDDGQFRGTATLMSLDNVTIDDINGFGVFREHGVERTRITSLHDSDVSGYNRIDSSYCAFEEHPETGGLTGYSMFRMNFTRTIQDTGCAAGNNVKTAKGNVFQGGFLSLVFGSDFEHGVSPSFGTPTEYGNWSHNYANDIRHTAFGVYGSATGELGSNHLGRNAYFSVFGNYVNNSRYITIQSGGNQTGVRISGNYVRGPTYPFAGGGSFAQGIGLNNRAHDYIISRNYMWHMDTFHHVGIALGFAVYNVSVSNNVLFDTGNPVVITGADFKWRNDTSVINGSTDFSDYSWKGDAVEFSDNYIQGGTDSGTFAFFIDAGYSRFFRNAVVDGPPDGIFGIDAGWSGLKTFVWVDWVDGFPAIPTITWPTIVPTSKEADYWVRTLRTGSITSATSGPVTVYVNSSDTDHWGTLATRCVTGAGSGADQDASDAQVFLWSGHTCGAVEDTTVYSFPVPGTQSVLMPDRWYNKTLSHSFNTLGTVVGSSQYAVRQSDLYFQPNIADSQGRWAIDAGHPYRITSFGVSPSGLVSTAVDMTWLLIFIAFLVLMLYGAWLIKRRRGDGGI